MELNAEAKPGSTGDALGTPAAAAAAAAAAACMGATVATDDEAPWSPMSEESTGLPGWPECPNPEKAWGLWPGGSPYMEGEVVRPRPKGEAVWAPE